MTAVPQLTVFQQGRHHWNARVGNATIGAPYIDIHVHARSKERAVKKALRELDRFMDRYERREASREVRTIVR